MDKLRFDLSPPERALLAHFRDLLIENRAVAALTSLSDPDEIDQRHIIEPLLLLRKLEERGALGSPAIDIGSGGGLPGIPIKIVRPELEMTLLEATAKKSAFLQHAIDRLGLRGVSVITSRAEDAAREAAHREAYGLALARAVAKLPVLVELALPFLVIGGRLATPKGSGLQGEIDTATRALSECGGEIEDVRRLELPWEGQSPTLVLVRKVAATPERYPRRAGIPAKRPL